MRHFPSAVHSPLLVIDLFLYMKIDWFISFFFSLSLSHFSWNCVEFLPHAIQTPPHFKFKDFNGFIEEHNHAVHVNYRMRLWLTERKKKQLIGCCCFEKPNRNVSLQWMQSKRFKWPNRSVNIVYKQKIKTVWFVF